MTILQTLQVRQSEIREAINALLGNDSRTEAEQTELEKLTSEGQKLEPEIRAAIVADPDPTETQTVETEDAEDRERRELRERAQVSAHIAAAMQGRTLDGAELEYNQSIGLKSAGAFPLDLLSPTVETRAVTTEDTAVQSRPWLDRLFARHGRHGAWHNLRVSPGRRRKLPGYHCRRYPCTTGQGTGRGRRGLDCWRLRSETHS